MGYSEFSRRVQIAVAMAALAVGSATVAQAAECPDFSDAAQIAEEQFDDLVATRAIMVDTSPYIREGEDATRAYLSVPSSPNDKGKRGLVFYVSTDLGVCLYYRASDGDARSFRLGIEFESLQGLIDETLGAVSDGASPVERRARLRGQEDPEGQSRSATSLIVEERREPNATTLMRRLSDVLFPEELREEIEALSSLTIVPAANIGIVPFAALDPTGDGKPLIATTMINIEAALRDVLSGRIYGIGQGIDPQAIAGDPDAMGDEEWIFPRLPGAAREAMAIAQRFGTTALIGSDATIEEVSPKMATAEYIHIAAHGFSSAHDPIDGSFLALSDGRLTARDIQSMEFMKSPLVVLSACQTGLGGRLEAGIIGLARAFLFAGSSSVLASLWNVDDEATSWIMVRFVENLESQPPAEALRLAQQAARQKWPDPNIWAAFVVFGSRTVSLASAAAIPQDQHLPVEAAFFLESEGAGREKLDLSLRTPVAPGQAIYVNAVNRSDRPVDAHFTYVDANGDTTAVGGFRMLPGEAVNEGLVEFTDSTVGREKLVATFVEADPSPIVADSSELAGLSPLSKVLTMVGAEAIGGLIPTRGITPLTNFGPTPDDGLVQAPRISGTTREDGGNGGLVRRAIGVVSVNVRSKP